MISYTLKYALHLHIANHWCLTIGLDVIEPVEIVRDRGVYFDHESTYRSNVENMFLRTSRGCLEREVIAQFVFAYTISPLDYWNSILANLPASIVATMQSPQGRSPSGNELGTTWSRDAGLVHASLDADAVMDPV